MKPKRAEENSFQNTLQQTIVGPMHFPNVDAATLWYISVKQFPKWFLITSHSKFSLRRLFLEPAVLRLFSINLDLSKQRILPFEGRHLAEEHQPKPLLGQQSPCFFKANSHVFQNEVLRVGVKKEAMLVAQSPKNDCLTAVTTVAHHTLESNSLQVMEHCQ